MNALSPSTVVLAFVLFFPLHLPGSVPAVPEAHPLARYDIIASRSPFTLASVLDQSNASFAQNLVLVGFAKLGGEHYVTVMDRTTQVRQTLSLKANAQGIEVVEVKPNSDPLQASAVLRKGGETATVKFDEAILKTVPQPVAQAPGPGNNNRPGMPGGPQPGRFIGPGGPNMPGPQGNPNRVIRRRVVVPNTPPQSDNPNP